MSSPERRFPILFLGSQMEVAGAQRLLLSQARWFHARGYPVQAVFFYDKQGLAQEWQARHDFPVLSLDAWKYRGFFLANGLRLLGGLLRLFRLLRGSSKAIVAFTPHSNVLSMPLAWLAGVPVRVATHHGQIEGASFLLARAQSMLVNSSLTSALVAVSSQVREMLVEREDILAERVVVIENGIESLEIDAFSSEEKKSLRAELGMRGKATLLLTVGRLSVSKGHTVLLKAIAQIAPQIPNALFAFAGEGALRAQLQEEAARLGIAQRVRFLGVREDVPQLLLAADIFVQPSLWEGLSLAMLEALLSGTPVLATRVEGVVDVIEEGRTGLLVPPGDVDALAAAILRLAQDADLRKRLGRAGRAHAQTQYSVERMCQQYEALIQGLFGEKTGERV